MYRLLIVIGVVVLASLTPGGRAAADPLWQAEVRAGYGIATGGSGARMSTRPGPVTLAAIAAIATSVEPPLSGYGGLLIEAVDRNSVGSVFGIRWTPHDSRLRLSGGGTWLFAPYMLFGATASVGACARWKPRIAVCGDIQLTAYFAGDDLADGRSVTQAQLVAGLVFDAM